MATVWDIIIATANKYGIDPFVAVADAIKESSGNPKAKGDYVNGVPDSIGLYQLNIHGEGAGMTVAARENPGTNADIALHQFARVQASGFKGSGGQLAAAAERPKYPVPYAVDVNNYVAQLHELTGRGMSLSNAAVSLRPASGGDTGAVPNTTGIEAARGQVGTEPIPSNGNAATPTTSITNPLDYLNPANFTAALTTGTTADFLIRAAFMIVGIVLLILGIGIAFKAERLIAPAVKAAAVAA